jgi:hypothetical protein
MLIIVVACLPSRYLDNSPRAFRIVVTGSAFPGPAIYLVAKLLHLLPQPVRHIPKRHLQNCLQVAH